LPNSVHEILKKSEFSKEDLISLLSCDENEKKLIFDRASEVNSQLTGNKISKFGLINISNICNKDCFYCKNRTGNYDLIRFRLKEKQVLDSIKFAHINHFDSVIFHSGGTDNLKYLKWIYRLTEKVSHSKRFKIDIILSIGEQSDDFYKKIRKSKIETYLLRIKTSNLDLYKQNHPDNKFHDLLKKIKTINAIKKNGLKAGSGILVGLPFQTIEHLANDILFLCEMKFDICEIEPFIEQENTPAYFLKKNMFSFEKRLELSYLMIAIIRLMMKNIKIASSINYQSKDNKRRFNIEDIGMDIKIINITPEIYNSYCQVKDTEKYVADLELKYC